MLSKKSAFIALGILGLVAARLIPHPPNFTPILSAGLFAGAFIDRKSTALFIPLLGMFLSDIFLGLHSGIPFVYAGIAAASLIGQRYLKTINLTRVGSSSILASLVFFVVSNFGVWVQSGFYSKDTAGMIQCYLAAVPFFGNTLASTLFYSLAAVYSIQYAIKRQNLSAVS